MHIKILVLAAEISISGDGAEETDHPVGLGIGEVSLKDLKCIRGEYDIGIGEDQELPSGRLRAGIPGVGRSQAAIVRDPANRITIGDSSGIIRGGVIDYNYFNGGLPGAKD
jgi:hypothetical protein